jgi:hypothetical protein
MGYELWAIRYQVLGIGYRVGVPDMGYRLWAMGYGLWAMGYIPPGTLTIAGSLSMSVRIDPATHITKLALELKLMDNNSARDTTLP